MKDAMERTEETTRQTGAGLPGLGWWPGTSVAGAAAMAVGAALLALAVIQAAMAVPAWSPLSLAGLAVQIAAGCLLIGLGIRRFGSTDRPAGQPGGDVSTLPAIARLLADEREPDQALARVLEEIGAAASSDHVHLLLIDASRHHLAARASAGSTARHQVAIPLHSGPWADVLRTGEPRCDSAAPPCPGHPGGDADQASEAFLGLPLRIGEQTGGLIVAHGHGLEPSADLSYLCALASMAAVAIRASSAAARETGSAGPSQSESLGRADAPSAAPPWFQTQPIDPARLARIFDLLPAGVGIVDRGGVVRFANAGCERILGRPRSEIVGRRYDDSSWSILTPDGEPDAEGHSLLRQVLETGQPVFGREFALVSADGARRVLSATGITLETGAGEPDGCLVILLDVTERHEAQARLRAVNDELERRVQERTADLERAVADLKAQIVERQRAEREVTTLSRRLAARAADLANTNRELESFTYSVSHDLRAPIRAVYGFSRALQEEIGDQLPPEGKRYLDLINTGARQMGLLIDELLAFSRSTAQRLEREDVDPTELVHHAWTWIASARDVSRVQLRVDALPRCVADRGLLRQVFANLLENAVKFTSTREVPMIHVGWCESDAGATYFVRDNGVGFDMRYAYKLFGVFQRLHQSDEYEGSGVGLAVVRRIVHRHGGRVWAEAAPDQGAAFYFTLGEGEADG